MMNLNRLKKALFTIICSLAMIISQFSSSLIYVVAEDDVVPSVTIIQNGPRILTEVVGIDNPVYQWGYVENDVFVPIDGATKSYYDYNADEYQMSVQVVVNEVQSNIIESLPKIIVFDVGQSTVTFDDNYSGKDENGNIVSGIHEESNVYVIKQKDNTEFSRNKINIKGNSTLTKYDITLDVIHLGSNPVKNKMPNSSGIGSYSEGVIDFVPTGTSDTKQKNAILRLKGENIVKAIHYSTDYNTDSSLKITDINGDGEYVYDEYSNSGSLYVPFKPNSNEEMMEYINSTDSYNHWNSAIGGDDGSFDDVKNFEIAGGMLHVITSYGDNCTAIGAGGNGPCDMLISGGKIIAHTNGTGTAIGGGIGWNSQGGSSIITITGGDIYAQNHGMIYVKATRNSDGSVASSSIVTKDEEYNEVVGGVAIGSGSSFFSTGSTSTVTITGGTVKAYGAFGNGIGGGNSSSGKGGEATITITGGTVDATSIGGGNSARGVGGKATVTIGGNAVVTLDKGIGGGDSMNDTGGEATITINNGSLSCDGVIGGGAGAKAGNGGMATVVVNNGTLVAKAIGGGTGGENGDGGAADITINGGKIETGSIGGGTTLNANGNLGYAKALITGGDISGQFLMAAAGDQACSFEMTGGTLHGVNTADSSKYQYSQANGGAVYMDDPNGIAKLSGGTIKDCDALNGGAIYMTAGSFTISDEGTIKNCSAQENGGAIYLGGGELNILGGTLINNEAGNNGGAALVNGGTVVVRGGLISDNTATNSGGGIAVNNGDYAMYGGTISKNTAEQQSGGAVYVTANGKNVNVGIYSGVISENYSKENGGAVAVVGANDGTEIINVQIGVNKQHFDANEKRIICDHDSHIDFFAEKCPQIIKNRTVKNGGAFYVNGNDNTSLKMYCLEESGNTVDESELSYFMKVEGGHVLLSTIMPDENGILHEEDQKLNSLFGNIQIENTIYATGGIVDIWGKMINPRTAEIITVDMLTANDKFTDHRYDEDYYKLIYYENFKDPVTNIVTGQYKAFSIPFNAEVTISGNIYEHPGYTISGWNTAADGGDDGFAIFDDPNKATGWYRVGEKYLFDGNPISDLYIYAIWEPNGYKVYFDANIPLNTPYSGEMEEYQMFTYDIKDNLYLNKWVYPGHVFVGWNTEKDGTGTPFSDGEEILNLTWEDSITLYAQWSECTHDPSEHHYTYSVINDGTTIQAECDCQGYYELATINAQDVTYDQSEHPAWITYYPDASTKDQKVLKDFVISYTYKALDSNEEKVVITTNPYNAGEYTATIAINDVVANVDFVIEKASQDAPRKPVLFDVNVDKNNNQSVLEIYSVADSALKTEDATYDSKKEYQIVYYNGTERVETVWIPEYEVIEKYAAQFNLDVALTNYYVYARYGEGTNYLASNKTAADIPYFFGDVKVYVSAGEGITYSVRIADGNDALNGVVLNIGLENNEYYFPKDFEVSQVTYVDGVISESTKMDETVKLSEYHLTNIVNYSEIYITIPDAKKYTKINGKVTEKEVFGSVTTNAADISRDSAYTAYFEVKNYDSNEYEPLRLLFSLSDNTAVLLPTNTTIIMLDKKNGGYYYYNVKNPVNEIILGDFTRMGTADDEFTNYCKDMNLQFAIDFSSAGVLSSEEVITSLIANKMGDNGGDTGSGVLTTLNDKASFELSTSREGLTRGIGYSYTPSNGVASKWDYRNMAILLKPKPGIQIPSDAYIIFSQENRIIVSHSNEEGYFVMPISSWNTNGITATLTSNLFPTSSTNYGFDVEWRVAYSLANQSPVNGEVVASTNLVFATDETKMPSIKITSDNQLYKTGDPMVAELSFKHITENDSVKLTLMRKTDSGTYTSTGWTQDITMSNDESQNYDINVNLAGQSDGSYAIQVVAKENFDKVAEAIFYFIINNEE